MLLLGFASLNPTYDLYTKLRLNPTYDIYSNRSNRLNPTCVLSQPF